MSSSELVGEWARVRACWIERRVWGPYHSQYAVVRIDPPAIPHGQTAAVERVLVSPHFEGGKVFPLSLPIAVYVYTAVRPGALERWRIRSKEVQLDAWCELYANR